MILARVIGNVVSPVQHPFLDRRKLLVVRPVNPDGEFNGEPDGIAVDRVAINAVMGSAFPKELGRLDESLARLDQNLDLGALPAPRTLATCVRHLRARHELNRHYTAEIRQLTQLPTLELPQLSEGIRGAEQLTTLAASLLAQPGHSS